MSTADGDLDADRLSDWLSDVVEPALSSVTIRRLAGGHSSGAWRVDVIGGPETRAMVLKAPNEPSMVYQRDACREASIIGALSRMGAPVPAVIAVDSGTAATGRPCFVMEYVEGRAVSDEVPGGYHGDGWFRDAEGDVQRAIWESFHDALAALHCADAAKAPDASHGPNGIVDVLEYWHAALLDALPADDAPRQLALLDWLRHNVPPGADDEPAVCMGDARLANCLIDGTDVRALVDFEVAYLGNPVADVGYSLFFDSLQRGHSDRPISTLPSADETWERWSRATGRATDRRDYWTALGATILCVTASRAMVQWGVPAESIESTNFVVTQWEAAVEKGITMIESTGTFADADEDLHRFDPDVWSWNESWFFSWIDLDGGPAGFFRVGVLPNQRRAMLWAFINIEGEWLGIEESRLSFDDLDLTSGVAYDKWGLRFAWRPEPPLLGARFTCEGSFLARSGPRAGAYVPVSIDLTCRSTGDCFGTGTGDVDASAYDRRRFEQSLDATGAVVIDGKPRPVRAGAHRDRSWGPREWRVAFTLGDFQSPEGQLYFVGAPGRGGGGYLRDASGELRQLSWADGSLEYDDTARTIAPGKLGLVVADGTRVDVELEPITPSVAFDMAHTCEAPEAWLYWRTLVEARAPGWDGACRGWFEASRYGCG